jgi:hypothetical protein
MKKKHTFSGQKDKNKPSGPNNEIWDSKAVYDRVIYPSIRNYTWSKKKHNFRGQKGENKPSEPLNGIWGPKLLWSCDISIDRQFYIGE